MEKKDIMTVIYNRGTATYRNGKLDFSHGEGGNNHIHCYDETGQETGYIWFDTHVGEGRYGFCDKSALSCSGVFRRFITENYPQGWAKDNDLFDFTEETFAEMMEYVLDTIR